MPCRPSVVRAQDRYIDWFRDLGFWQRPGVETKAAPDIAAFLSQPQRGADPISLARVRL